MKNSFTLPEKITVFILLIIGILFSCNGIVGYIEAYIICYDYLTSYRILETTYVSNLLNGNLLIISALLFFKKKTLGVLLFQYTGVMFMLYAINLNLFHLIAYNYYDALVTTIQISILLSFGAFLYFYFKRRNLIYNKRYILPLFIILGVLTYSYINLFFCDWYSFLKHS